MTPWFPSLSSKTNLPPSYLSFLTGLFSLFLSCSSLSPSPPQQASLPQPKLTSSPPPSSPPPLASPGSFQPSSLFLAPSSSGSSVSGTPSSVRSPSQAPGPPSDSLLPEPSSLRSSASPVPSLSGMTSPSSSSFPCRFRSQPPPQGTASPPVPFDLLKAEIGYEGETFSRRALILLFPDKITWFQPKHAQSTIPFLDLHRQVKTLWYEDIQGGIQEWTCSTPTPFAEFPKETFLPALLSPRKDPQPWKVPGGQFQEGRSEHRPAHHRNPRPPFSIQYQLASTLEEQAEELVKKHSSGFGLAEEALAHELVQHAYQGEAGFSLLSSVLEKLGWTGTDQDDVAEEFVQEGRYGDLLIRMAKHPQGRLALDSLFEALVTGIVTEHEEQMAKVILTSKYHTLVSGKKLDEVLASGSLKSFPFQLPGFTVLSPAHFEVKRKDKGTIWVKLNWEACLFQNYPEPMKTLPQALCQQGIDLPEEEPIEIVMYDQGEKREQTLPLFFLLLEHQTNAQLVSKFVEAGLLLAGGSGLVRSAGKGVWVLIDKIVLGLAVTTSVIEEHRGWMLSTFGEKGAKFLKTTHYLNFALGLYGGVRVVKEMPKLVSTFRATWKQLKASVKSSTSLGLDPEEQALRLGLEQEGEQLFTQVDELEQVVKQEAPLLSSSNPVTTVPTHEPHLSSLGETKPAPWLPPERASMSPLPEPPWLTPEEAFALTKKPVVPEVILPPPPQPRLPRIQVDYAKERAILTQRLSQTGQKAALTEVQEAVQAAERGQLLGLETWLKEGASLETPALVAKILQLKKAKTLWKSQKLPIKLGKQGQVEVVMMAERQAGAGSKTGDLSATGTDGAVPSGTLVQPAQTSGGKASAPSQPSTLNQASSGNLGGSVGVGRLPNGDIGIEIGSPLNKPNVNPTTTAQFVQTCKRKPQTRTGPEYEYQRKHLGSDEITVEGGGTKVEADGINIQEGYLQDTKFISQPERSPYIEGSSIPAKILPTITADVDNLFSRYSLVIHDPGIPIKALEVIVNRKEAVSFFQKLMQKYHIPGRIVVRP